MVVLVHIADDTPRANLSSPAPSAVSWFAVRGQGSSHNWCAVQGATLQGFHRSFEDEKLIQVVTIGKKQTRGLPVLSTYKVQQLFMISLEVETCDR
jgi:hypothetical protein